MQLLLGLSLLAAGLMVALLALVFLLAALESHVPAIQQLGKVLEAKEEVLFLLFALLVSLGMFGLFLVIPMALFCILSAPIPRSEWLHPPSDTGEGWPRHRWSLKAVLWSGSLTSLRDFPSSPSPPPAAFAPAIPAEVSVPSELSSTSPDRLSRCLFWAARGSVVAPLLVVGTFFSAAGMSPEAGAAYGWFYLFLVLPLSLVAGGAVARARLHYRYTGDAEPLENTMSGVGMALLLHLLLVGVSAYSLTILLAFLPLYLAVRNRNRTGR